MCAKLAENLRKITRKSDWTLVNGDKIGQTKIEEVLRYKTAQKAVKSEQKWSYVVDIRTYKYVIKSIRNGTTVKQTNK